MTVVFVNDGSTDHTQEIAERAEFDEVVKVELQQNQGYGSAIQEGWRRASEAEILGFIDADGTCDPDYSVPLINCLIETRADVVLAARLSPGTKMPGIRKLGNILFAKLLGAVSRKKLTDCASGFRVLRQSSLPLISPLPKGMHFTPAIGAICLLDPRLRIEEVPMPYQDRIGRSKLSVIKDGMRFLYVILFTICCYSPIRTMLLVSGIWTSLWVTLMTLLPATGESAARPILAWGGADRRDVRDLDGCRVPSVELFADRSPSRLGTGRANLAEAHRVQVPDPLRTGFARGGSDRDRGVGVDACDDRLERPAGVGFSCRRRGDNGPRGRDRTRDLGRG